MRQFYLYKNQSGYYNAVFVDPVSGKKGADKSTHTKDKIQATVIASSWLEHGIPEARGNSRRFTLERASSGLNLKDICERVNQDEALKLMTMLSQKFNLDSSAVIPATPNVQVQIQEPPKPKTSGIPFSSYLFRRQVFG